MNKILKLTILLICLLYNNIISAKENMENIDIDSINSVSVYICIDMFMNTTFHISPEIYDINDATDSITVYGKRTIKEIIKLLDNAQLEQPKYEIDTRGHIVINTASEKKYYYISRFHIYNTKLYRMSKRLKKIIDKEFIRRKKEPPFILKIR